VLNNAFLFPGTVGEGIAAHGCTGLYGVPGTYQILIRKSSFLSGSYPTLRYFAQAGGKLAPTFIREVAAAFPAARFFVMYGQTEATARMSYLPPERAGEKLGSIGVAIPGGRFWLEGEEGGARGGAGGAPENAEAGPGELVYAGDNVTMGYAERGEDLALGDERGGVLRTGDVARRDADGFYYIVGRKKRFLKLYGNRCNMDEAEALVSRAFGLPCACAGADDLMRVFVECAPPADDPDGAPRATPEAVRRFLSETTGVNQAAFAVAFVVSLPRSASGKVMYSELL